MLCYFDILLEEKEPFPRISRLDYQIGKVRKTFIVDTPKGSYYQESVGEEIDYVLRTFLKDIVSCIYLISDNTEYKMLCIKRELDNLGLNLVVRIPLVDVITCAKVKEITGGHLSLEESYKEIFEKSPLVDRIQMMKDILNL